MKRYEIRDWANNLMNFGEFKSFDAAWGFLLKKFKKEDDLQEYEVVEVGGE